MRTHDSKLLAEAMLWIRRCFRWLSVEITNDRPEAGSCRVDASFMRPVCRNVDPAVMTLNAHLLMHLYRDVSLKWRLKADVLLIDASGSYCAGRTFTSIIKGYIAFTAWLHGLSVKSRRRCTGLLTKRFSLLRAEALNLA